MLRVSAEGIIQAKLMTTQESDGPRATRRSRGDCQCPRRKNRHDEAPAWSRLRTRYHALL